MSSDEIKKLCNGCDLLDAVRDYNSLTLTNLIILHDKCNINEGFTLQNMTALQFASYNDNFEIVKALVNAGANVNHRERYFGITALDWATKKEIIKFLLNVDGIDVNIADYKNHATKLHCVCAENTCDKEIVELLINRGAEINKRNKLGETALYLASFKGHENIVEFLINRGADISILDNDGKSYLDVKPTQNSLFHKISKMFK